MQTVGQLLKAARLKKNWSIFDVEKETRIRRKYLLALEEDAFEALPGAAYVVGFLKNYSRILNLDPERILALYRREYDERRIVHVLPHGLVSPVNKPFLTVTPKVMAISAAVCFFLVFLGYLLFEYRFAVGVPRLTIESPQTNSVTHEDKITILGRTDPDTIVTVNGQELKVQVDGSFSQEVTLIGGVNTYTIIATNKLGKDSRSIVVVSRE